MLSWRNETLPRLPTHISEIVEALRNPKWQQELSYDMTYADKMSGDTEHSEHHIEAWSVGTDNECHIVFGTPTYAAKFKDLDVAYLDSAKYRKRLSTHDSYGGI